MQNDMFDSLVHNAIDFMEVSLQEFKDRPKYSVIHFCSSVEIFFKARLLAEHWSLVVAKPEHANLPEFQAGKSLTVTLKDAITRLKNIAGENLSEDARKTFEGLREHRNKLVHFFHEDYIGNRVNKGKIEQIVAEQCRAWLHLHRLLTSQWKDLFNGFANGIDKLNGLMLRHREFLDEKFKSLKPELQKLRNANVRIAACSSCGFEAAKQTEGNPPVEEYNCLVCGTWERYLRVTCPSCGEKQIYWGDGDIQCARCPNVISLDDVINEYVRTGVRHKEMGDIQLAYCACCENPTPSVAALENNWICLACLEVHSAPDYCECCGVFVTGDLEGSGYFGCSQCDGRQGRDDD